MKKLEIFSPAFVALLWAVFCFAPGCADTTPPKPVVQDSTKIETLEASFGGICTALDVDTATRPKSRAVGMNGKYWMPGQNIRIKFLSGTGAQQQMLRDAYATIAQTANLNFVYVTTGDSEIRARFDPGSAWSYIGNDTRYVGQNSATINVGFGGPSTYLHEALHSVGLLHGHQLAGMIDWIRANVIADLSGAPNFWNIATIESNVLNYHNPATTTNNGPDPFGVMMYPVPPRWNQAGIAYTPGPVMTAQEISFIAGKYPGRVNPIDPPITGTFTLTLQQRQALLTRAQGVQNAAQISLASAIAAKVAADSSVAFTKRTLGL